MSTIERKNLKAIKSYYYNYLRSRPIGLSVLGLISLIRMIHTQWIMNNLDSIRYEIETDNQFESKDVRITEDSDAEINAPMDQFDEIGLNFNSNYTQFVAGIRVFKEVFNQYTFEVFLHDNRTKSSSVRGIEHLTLSDIKWIIRGLIHYLDASTKIKDEDLEDSTRMLLALYSKPAKDVLMMGTLPKPYKFKYQHDTE